MFAKNPLARAPKHVELDFALSRTQISFIALGLFGSFATQYLSLAYVRAFHKRFLASLDAKSRADFGVRCASSVWGTVCGAWAAKLLREGLKTSTDTLSRICTPRRPIDVRGIGVCLAVGYFVWDSIVSGKYYDVQYFLHGIISVITFGLPQLMPKGFAPVRRKLFALGGSVTVFVGSLHHDQGGYGIDDRLQSRRARRVRALGVRSIRRGFADDVSVLYRRLRDVHRGSGQSEVVVRMVRLRERHAPNHERHLVDGHLEVIISVR